MSLLIMKSKINGTINKSVKADIFLHCKIPICVHPIEDVRKGEKKKKIRMNETKCFKPKTL